MVHKTSYSKCTLEDVATFLYLYVHDVTYLQTCRAFIYAASPPLIPLHILASRAEKNTSSLLLFILVHITPFLPLFTFFHLSHFHIFTAILLSHFYSYSSLTFLHLSFSHIFTLFLLSDIL